MTFARKNFGWLPAASFSINAVSVIRAVGTVSAALLIGCAAPAGQTRTGSEALDSTNRRAAPDEERLGKSRGYPIGTATSYFFDESVRVGSFSHHGEIFGLYGGVANVLAASPNPMPLPDAAGEPAYRWRIDHSGELTIEDYLARQRVMGLLIIKDGVVQLERYQFWTFPGETRRFALLGVYGQMIFIDPQLKLVMVQTAANATARAGQTSLAREANAVWRGLLHHYGAR